MNEIEKFHIENEYYIRINENNENEFSVLFPSNAIIEPKIKGNIYTYKTVKNGLHVSDKDSEKTIICPKYISRILVMQDVCLKASQRGISSFLIYLIKGDKVINDKFYKFLFPNLLNEEEVEREDIIVKNIYDVLRGKNVMEGCSVLQQYFNSGGIL